MAIVEAQSFCEEFLATLRSVGSWGLYSHDDSKLWTCAAIRAAKETMERLGLEVWPEYFRLDLMASERVAPSEDFNWYLRIAFEHENANSWIDELCKLAHVVADLRVLVLYHSYARGRSVVDELQSAIEYRSDRIFSVPDSKWLFVVGPRMARPECAFSGYTLNYNGSLEELKLATSFAPAEWPDYCNSSSSDGP